VATGKRDSGAALAATIIGIPSKAVIINENCLTLITYTHHVTIMETTTYSRIKKMSPQFHVVDIDRSVEFYTKVLGFDIDFRYEDFYAGIVKDGCSIHLKLMDSTSIEKSESRRLNENLDIVFLVDAIEDLYQELSNKPVTFVEPLRSMPYGKEFYIADPDGYVIAFLSEA
jgi:catechol 2,3-dioxygenase-like lactoylglutathione lyase family enzyme